jgi:hypothetical protein
VKRGNGQGSVYRHGRAWEAVGYIDGRRRVFRAKTSREARQRLENATRSAERGERLRHRLACASAVRRLNRPIARGAMHKVTQYPSISSTRTRWDRCLDRSLSSEQTLSQTRVI